VTYCRVSFVDFDGVVSMNVVTWLIGDSLDDAIYAATSAPDVIRDLFDESIVMLGCHDLPIDDLGRRRIE